MYNSAYGQRDTNPKITIRLNKMVEILQQIRWILVFADCMILDFVVDKEDPYINNRDKIKYLEQTRKPIEDLVEIIKNFMFGDLIVYRQYLDNIMAEYKNIRCSAEGFFYVVGEYESIVDCREYYLLLDKYFLKQIELIKSDLMNPIDGEN